MLSCPVCAHYQDYILLSQLTWTNHSNHLQNAKNTLKMQDKKKQIYQKKENVRQHNLIGCKITNYTFCTLIGEKYYTKRYFPVLNFAPTGLLMIRTMDRLLILTKSFSEKLFETLQDRIGCDGKNRFLPLYHFRNNLSFTYINLSHPL